MAKTLHQFVRERANYACEYCHLPQTASRIPFEVDHIIARQHRGQTVEDNLALACSYCNGAKGPNIAGIDPETGELTRLFHPRRDAWELHFAWSRAQLVGLTDIGRVTVDVLAINAQYAVALRESLLLE